LKPAFELARERLVALKAGVERDVEYCCVMYYQPVRRPLESQALRVLLQCFTDGGSEQAVKVKLRKPNSVCQRFQREILIEVGLDVHEHRQ
jgi:hypothetical protein